MGLMGTSGEPGLNGEPGPQGPPGLPVRSKSDNDNDNNFRKSDRNFQILVFSYFGAGSSWTQGREGRIRRHRPAGSDGPTWPPRPSRLPRPEGRERRKGRISKWTTRPKKKFYLFKLKPFKFF
jgi:hypothetical protein